MAKEVDIEIKKSAFWALTAGRLNPEKEWVNTVQKRWKDYHLAEQGLETIQEDADQKLMDEYMKIKDLRPTMQMVDGKPVVKGIG